MNEDPIIEETRKAGRDLFARFNHDMHAVCEYLRHKATERGFTSASAPPRRPDNGETKKKVG